MKLTTTVTQHIMANADRVWAVVTDLPGSAGTRKSLTQDLAEIAAKAEAL
ncbi:hypothetical protein AB4Y86_03555 [Arthrobacter sp. 2YAF22_2]